MGVADGSTGTNDGPCAAGSQAGAATHPSFQRVVNTTAAASPAPAAPTAAPAPTPAAAAAPAPAAAADVGPMPVDTYHFLDILTMVRTLQLTEI